MGRLEIEDNNVVIESVVEELFNSLVLLVLFKKNINKGCVGDEGVVRFLYGIRTLGQSGFFATSGFPSP